MPFAIKHALRGISRRKLKNVINTLGILIGVSLLAGVQIATDSLVNAMQETVSLRYGNADIVIQKGEYSAEFFNFTVYEALKNDPILAPHIDGIAPRITSRVSITSIFTTKQTEPFVTLIGIDDVLDAPFGEILPEEEYGNNNFNLSEFTFRQCIIGKRLGESVIDFNVDGDGRNQELSLPILAPIEMSFLDANGNFRAFEGLNVKGIAQTAGKGILTSSLAVVMKLSHAQALFNTTITGINNLVVSTTLGNENARNVTDLIEERLVYYLGEEEGLKFKIDAQKYDAFDDIKDSIKSFRIVLYVFGSLIIISGVMLILNITLMNIDERQRSIGILRAIGMTQGQLITTLLTESMLLGGVGSFLGLGGGVISGLGIIFLLENFLNIGEILQNIPLVVNPIGLIIAFAIGLLISLLAALYPAWRASRIDIVKTINEIESEKIGIQRSGSWSILLGGILLLAGSATIAIALVLTPDWTWMMFIGGVLGFLLGFGISFARIVGPKIAFNVFALSWIASGLLALLVLNPYLNNIGVAEDKALYAFLIAQLGLVFGAIIFVALNLEWLSNRFNDIFQSFKRFRSIGIISMRYIGKKKTRSALTFAIFGVILTMNVFLAVFTGSFTLGFEDFAIKEEGGVNIIAYSPFGSPSTEEDPFQTIFDADPNVEKVVGMKFRFSLSGAISYISFIAENESRITEDVLPVPTDMWGINDEFLEMTEYKMIDVWDGLEGEDPWIAAQDPTKNYVILPNLLREFGYDEAGVEYYVNSTVGDTIQIPAVDYVNGTYVTNETLVDYTIVGFVETTSYSMLFANFLFTSEQSAIFDQIGDNDTAYLIQTNPRLNTDEVVEVSRNIESKLLGFDTISLRSRIESFLEFIMQAVNFMQAFVSLGLVVGVLGLIVVSLRGVTERTREIGMMRALGFQRAEVITAVVIEIFAVAFVGLIIGFINGFILGYGMFTQYLAQYDFTFIIPWAALGLFIGITIILSIIAAVIPARRASKIPPSEALRYTG
ncbi:MAG TPA: FtsX-like permease family protein [candidate division Zixibacteria bacterium]|nr:FtsX-like permease family protein [candidate division Zixibacteria bacterium]